MADLFPTVRVQPSPELRKQWATRWENPEHTARYEKLLLYHQASVADFKTHRARYGDEYLGTVQYARTNAPYILAVTAIVTMNPLLLVAALGMKVEQTRNAKDRRL